MIYIGLSAYQILSGYDMAEQYVIPERMLQRSQLARIVNSTELFVFILVFSYSIYFVKKASNFEMDIFQFSIVNMLYFIFLFCVVICVSSILDITYGNFYMQMILPILYNFALFIIGSFLILRMKQANKSLGNKGEL